MALSVEGILSKAEGGARRVNNKLESDIKSRLSKAIADAEAAANKAKAAAAGKQEEDSDAKLAKFLVSLGKGNALKDGIGTLSVGEDA